MIRYSIVTHKISPRIYSHIINSAAILILAISAFAWAALAEELPTQTVQAGQVFRDCPNCPEMVVVPTGAFKMGSSETDTVRDLAEVTGKHLEFSRAMASRAFATEHPQHPVTIDQPFALGKYLVTRDEFADFVRETGYSAEGRCLAFGHDIFSELSGSGWQHPGFSQTGRDPVVCVSWKDANAYIGWLNRKLSRQPSNDSDGQYRLPSEAQWEYAARAGTSSARWWGDAVGSGNADCTACGSQWDYVQTAPVGSFKPNPFGLYEIMGNAFEWTADCWHQNYEGAPGDGSMWSAGNCEQRVMRGGSWFSEPYAMRSAARTKFDPGKQVNFVGFRVEKSL